MMKSIRARMECDKCGQQFDIIVPTDANNDGHATIFETVLNSSDTAVRESKNEYEEWGADQGQHFGPCCWQEVSEELFIQEIRDGKITKAQLQNWSMIEDYGQYVPRPQLTHGAAA
jgi:hypothetical protein